ncbi:hypothetical protein [Ulvibacterium sp.]|uniref:hypothetical protein n=1 Tax=Ulvibacterium sp. TaxID=2665914 RepID=UPI003CC68561
MNSVNKSDSAHGKPLQNWGGMASFWNNRYDFVSVKVGIFRMVIVCNPNTHCTYMFLPLAGEGVTLKA